MKKRKIIKKRAHLDALIEASGETPGFFENSKDYEKRALLQAAENISGETPGWFESDQDFIDRVMPRAMRNISGEERRLFEKETDYNDLATDAAIQTFSGDSQGLFENKNSYYERSMRDLANNMSSRSSSFTYLVKEGAYKENALAESSEEIDVIESDNTILTSATICRDPFSQKHPVLFFLLIGIAVDVFLFVFTLNGTIFSPSVKAIYSGLLDVVFFGSLVIGIC